MDDKLLPSLVFLIAGATLGGLALRMIAGAFHFRQSAVRATGTVVDFCTKPITRKGLESFYRKGLPRPHAGGRRTSSHRTRWIKIAYQDAAGEDREITRFVYGSSHFPGERISILYLTEQPADVRMDSPLELYGRGLVIGAISAIFITAGACIWWEVVSVGG